MLGLLNDAALSIFLLINEDIHNYTHTHTYTQSHIQIALVVWHLKILEHWKNFKFNDFIDDMYTSKIAVTCRFWHLVYYLILFICNNDENLMKCILKISSSIQNYSDEVIQDFIWYSYYFIACKWLKWRRIYSLNEANKWKQ